MPKNVISKCLITTPAEATSTDAGALQKRTILNVGQSYTNSYTHATMDHDVGLYIIKDKAYDNVEFNREPGLGVQV